MTYEWDSRKADTNLHKHNVSFSEAASVFLDPVAHTFDDPNHSGQEYREITIGTSGRGRILFVSHCARGNSLRIISARKTTRKERQQYAKRIGGTI